MICHAWCSPNVDFYSGIVLRAMGIPISMYTVLFAVARTVGWVSQVCGAICIHPCARVVWCVCITIAPRLYSPAPSMPFRCRPHESAWERCCAYIFSALKGAVLVQWKEMAEQQQVLPKISRPRQVRHRVPSECHLLCISVLQLRVTWLQALAVMGGCVRLLQETGRVMSLLLSCHTACRCTQGTCRGSMCP